jgi:hypothetical protein
MSSRTSQRDSSPTRVFDKETGRRSSDTSFRFSRVSSGSPKIHNTDVTARRFTSDMILPAQPRKSPGIVAREEIAHAVQTLKKFAKFIGPGFMVAVAYIDPGNYATDIAAGADTRFSLLFMVLLSNLIAIFFQTLCIKMGSVTGGSLGDNCREHLPRWMFIGLYVISEIAIIATDVAEVSSQPLCVQSSFNS